MSMSIAMSQINPRFGTNTLHNLQRHSFTYPLSDIPFKKTYCIPLFLSKLFQQKCS